MPPTWMEHAVKWSSVYVYRGVPLLTLAMHLILATFSESRRREHRSWKRLLVWVAYQLTDWGPAYVMGNLYLEPTPREKMIIAFWVPFLLLHHARPDNISAYTIEDSELWIRLILSVPLTFVGSIIIVYRFILTDCTADWSLRWASGIMLFLGVCKYLESAGALWLSNLGHLGEWTTKKIDKSDLECISKKLAHLSDLKDDEATVKEKDDEALLVAHGLFEICKGAFCDYTVDTDREVVRKMFFGKWESMCMVVEMELSLMYDILYTKASRVHTWVGYAIRLASPPLTATALLLFGLHCKEGMKGVDKVISYVLLSTTFLLDVRWLLRALASAWTHSFFEVMPHNWLKHEFWCEGKWKKLRGFVVSLPLSRLSLWLWTCACHKEPKGYRRWAGTFGQYNLLDQCTGGNTNTQYSIPRRAIESGDHLRLRGFEPEDNSSGVEIPEYVKKLVFSIICAKLFSASEEEEKKEAAADEPQEPPGPGKRPGVFMSGSPDKTKIDATGMDPRPSGPRKHPTDITYVSPGLMDPEQYVDTITDEPPGTPDSSEHVCNGVDTEYSPWPACPGELICNDLDNGPPLWPPYPGERVCIGINNEPPPWPLYPREQICIGINNEPPMWPPCPRQVTPRPHLLPDEQAAIASEPYGQHIDHWRCDQDPPQPGDLRCYYPPTTYCLKQDANKDMRFPQELQEVILIWHIATDIFLSCSPGETSKEHAKAIKQMSDYMMFLLFLRPDMLPGLQLRSLYVKTCHALEKIWEVATVGYKPVSYTKRKVKGEVAMWMLEKRDHLNDPNSAIWEGTQMKNYPGITTVWEGAQLAGMLLSLVVPDGEKWRSQTTPKVRHTIERLAYWIPDLNNLPAMTMAGMLGFILDAWVSLLIYASIRCNRDSHAKQLSRGGELTTLVWIITEHAEDGVVNEKLPLFFSS